MTRNRGVPLNPNPTPESPNRIWVADELVAKYYSQRATDGGLIVTESILPSPESGAMPGVPGLWLKEHEEGWKMVLLPFSYFIPSPKTENSRSHKQSTGKTRSFTPN